MNQTRRVLVVEDRVEDLDIYAEVVEAGGFTVDKAADFADAMAKIDRTTYAAMVVDISLGAKGDDTEGLTLLAYANSLGEGTPVVVLTGNLDPQIAADVVSKLGAFQYLSKTHIAKVGAKVLVAAIKSATDKGGLNLYRGAGDIVESLCGSSEGSSEADLWVDRCLRALRPKGGFAGLRDFLDGLLAPVLPLLPPINLAPDKRLAVDEGSQIMRGIFWSKGLGRGVEVIVMAESHAGGADDLPQRALREHRRASLLGFVVPRLDLEREEFA